MADDLIARAKVERDLAFIEEEAMRFAKGRGGPVAAKLRAVAANYAAVVAALEARDARVAELEAERDEAMRRRDAWKARAENHVEIVNALRAKTAGKDSRTLSKALLGAAFAEAEARAEAAEAEHARLKRYIKEDLVRRKLAESILIQRDAAEARVKELEDAGENLIRIVEGIEGAMMHGTWRAEKSTVRMKDADEWVRFYCAVRSRAAPEGEKT